MSTTALREIGISPNVGERVTANINLVAQAATIGIPQVGGWVCVCVGVCVCVCACMCVCLCLCVHAGPA